MPMLTYHPLYGPMYPSRAGRRLRGLGAGEVVASSAQVLEAVRNLYCAKAAEGKAMSVAEIIAAGSQFIEQAKANGMDSFTAGLLVAQISSLAYSIYSGGVTCPKPTTPTPPTTPPATPAATGGIGAGAALGIGAALVGGALLLKK